MRADRVEQADSIIELFTKDADNHQVSLSEMQCIWYEQNGADSYLRTKQYGKALKKSLSIDTVHSLSTFYFLPFFLLNHLYIYY